MKKITFIILLALACAASLQAQKRTFTREYSYQASEDDSRNSARANATTQMRNTLLREVGEFLRAERVLIQNNYSEKIEAITAGIVEMTPLDERWDGTTYYIKAEMVVDPKDLERRITEVLLNKELTEELEKARKRTLVAEAEIVRLKEELGKNRNNQELRAAYQQQAGILASNEYLTRGNIALSNGWNKEALEEYTKAYNQMPQNGTTYRFMGNVYSKVNTEEGFRRSIECYKQYLNLYPSDVEMMILLGDTYKRWNYSDASNYYRKAVDHYKDIIMGNPNNASAYEMLAEIFTKMGNRDEAGKYSERAKELQLQKVAGRVTNENGRPITGVSVFIKGRTANRTLSDWKGEYSIPARPDDVLVFSFVGYSAQEINTGGRSIIDVRLQRVKYSYKRKYGGGKFLSYTYDNSPVAGAGPMHGISLYSLDSRDRWGWYASFRGSSSVFEEKTTRPVSTLSLNAGAMLTLFNPVSLYLSPGVGHNRYHHSTRGDEWFFNPEIGMMLDFKYVTLFGGLKYPLLKNDSRRKLLYSAGIGIALDRFADAISDGDFPHYLLSYIYDSSPVAGAGPMHGVSLFSFLDDERWGWYGSFRANHSFFAPKPTRAVSTFAFNAGAVLTLFKPVSLYFGPGVGRNSYNDSMRGDEWFFNPEIGVVFDFENFSLSGGLKYPLPAKDHHKKNLYSLGLGMTVGDWDDDREFIAYVVDVPLSATADNPPGFIGFSFGVLRTLGGYVSVRANQRVFGGGDDSGHAHLAGTTGVFLSPFEPLFFSVGLGAYWEWSKQSSSSYLMPEIGLHLPCFETIFLSFGRSFPGFKNKKIIYNLGIGVFID